MWTLKLSFRRFFLTALLGFITIQNYIKNLLKRKERRKKKRHLYPKGQARTGPKNPCEVPPGKLSREKTNL